MHFIYIHTYIETQNTTTTKLVNNRPSAVRGLCMHTLAELCKGVQYVNANLDQKSICLNANLHISLLYIKVSTSHITWLPCLLCVYIHSVDAI